MMKEEPMDYTISRQAAIDALGEAPEVWTDSPEELAELNRWEMDVAAIKAVPPAKPRWIPCSERLPKENAGYLVQLSYGIRDVLRWANILEKVDDYDFYNKKHGGWYEYDSEWGYYEIDKVVAWMPLPELYREDGEAWYAR